MEKEPLFQSLGFFHENLLSVDSGSGFKHFV